MARRAGDLSLLTIGAIFVVVFTAMWAGVQYSRGELVPEETMDARERQLRVALWTTLRQWRADRGLDPVQKTPRVTSAAQEAANEFADGNRSAGGMTDTRSPEAPQPAGRAWCSQVPIQYTVSHPKWNETAGSQAKISPIADAVSDAVFPVLVAADETGLLRRTGAFLNGIGVVADGNELYVVYRSCAQRRLSP